MENETSASGAEQAAQKMSPNARRSLRAKGPKSRCWAEGGAACDPGGSALGGQRHRIA